MWSAFTTAIARDLSEFASVVGSDAAQMVHAAASGAGGGTTVVTGDADFPDVAYLGCSGNHAAALSSTVSGGAAGGGAGERLVDDDEAAALLALQEELDTFRLPLSEEEQQQFTRWANYDRAMDRDRWRMLLTESAEIQEAFEECVEGDDPCCTDDEFFSRYFWRLAQLRMSLAMQRAANPRKAGVRGGVGAPTTSAAGSEGLEGWEDDNEETSVLGGHAGSVAAGDDGGSGAKKFSAVDAQRAKRMRELERQVEMLKAQVASLTAENIRLRHQQQAQQQPSSAQVEADARGGDGAATTDEVIPSTGIVGVGGEGTDAVAAPVAAPAAIKTVDAVVVEEAVDDNDDDDWTKLT